MHQSIFNASQDKLCHGNKLVAEHIVMIYARPSIKWHNGLCSLFIEHCPSPLGHYSDVKQKKQLVPVKVDKGRQLRTQLR